MIWCNRMLFNSCKKWRILSSLWGWILRKCLLSLFILIRKILLGWSLEIRLMKRVWHNLCREGLIWTSLNQLRLLERLSRILIKEERLKANKLLERSCLMVIGQKVWLLDNLMFKQALIDSKNSTHRLTSLKSSWMCQRKSIWIWNRKNLRYYLKLKKLFRQ